MTHLQRTFINNETICLVILLKEGNQEKLLNYISDRIINLQRSQGFNTIKDFQKDLNQKVESVDINTFFYQQMNYITSMNALYKVLWLTLKETKQQHSSKLEMGSIIDLFTRRMLLYLQKQDFKEMYELWEQFKAFKENQSLPQKYDKFFLDQLIDDINSGIDYYPSRFQPYDLENLLNELESKTKEIKISFLKAKNFARSGDAFQAIQFMRRYFDRTLQANTCKEELSSIAKENLCVLNMVSITMKMGFSDESLLNLSEALRLSQGIGDEESINQCLIYLYQISQNLGHMKELQLLLEYSINHSLKLNNPSFLIQNCLNYWLFSRFIQQSNVRQNILLKKKIQWKEVLQHSVKKLFLIYDQNLKINQQDLLKNILYSFVTYELSVAIIQASNGFIQILQETINRYNYYMTDQIATLQIEACEIYAQYDPINTLTIISKIIQDMSEVQIDIYCSIILINAKLFNYREDQESADIIIEQISQKLDKLSPIIKEKLKSAMKQENGKEIQSRHILVRSEQQIKQIEQLLIQKNFDVALWQISQLEEWCTQHQLIEQKTQGLLLKIIIEMERNQISEAKDQINQLIQKGTQNYSLDLQAKIWKVYAEIIQMTKGNRNKKKYLLDSQNSMDFFKKSFRFALKLGNTKLMKQILFQMGCIEKNASPNLVSQSAELFCRVEAFTRSVKCVNQVSYLNPYEITQVNVKFLHFLNSIVNLQN